MRHSWTCAAILSVGLGCAGLVLADTADPAVTLRDSCGSRLQQGQFSEARALLVRIRALSSAAWVADLEALIGHLETAAAKTKARDFPAAQSALEAATPLAGTAHEVAALWRIAFLQADAAGPDAAEDARNALLLLHAAADRPEVKQELRMKLLQRLLKAEQVDLAETLLRANVAKLASQASASIAWQAEVQIFKCHMKAGQKDKALAILKAVRYGTPAQFLTDARHQLYLKALSDLNEWPLLEGEVQAVLKDPASGPDVKAQARSFLDARLRYAATSGGPAGALRTADQFMAALEPAQRDLPLLTTWLHTLNKAVAADVQLALGFDRVIQLELLSKESEFDEITNAMKQLFCAARAAAKGQGTPPTAPTASEDATLDLRLQLLAEFCHARIMDEVEQYRARATKFAQQAEEELAQGNTEAAAAWRKAEEETNRHIQRFLAMDTRSAGTEE